MNVLDLFSGIGGLGDAFCSAFGPKARIIAYCENDRYAQAVLLSRMGRGEIDRAPIWDDVSTLRGDMLPPIDAIVGGFPCQDISQAGRGIGMEKGKRSGLFFEIIRLVCELRPAFVGLENVAAILPRPKGGPRVIAELAALGYDCRWITLSAAEVGATHTRNRWWLLAHADASGKWGNPREGEDEGGNPKLAHPEGHNEGKLCRRSQEKLARPELYGLPARPPAPGDFEAWREIIRRWPEAQPSIRGMASRLPHRNDRLRALGNSVDRICAEEAFKILLKGRS